MEYNCFFGTVLRSIGVSVLGTGAKVDAGANAPESMDGKAGLKWST